MRPNQFKSIRITGSKHLMLALCALTVTAAHAGNPYPPGYQGLMPLPENPHYFQWKGLPMFVVRGGSEWAGVPMNSNAVGQHNDSRFFCKDVDRGQISNLTAEEAVRSDKQYAALAKEAPAYLAQDRILLIHFFHKNWCLGTTSDELIKRAIKATWQYPNVAYSYIYEGTTPDSWVKRFKALGAQANPNIFHMFYSVQNGEPPSSIDFQLGEGKDDGIQWGFPKNISRSYYDAHPRPLMRDAVVQCLCFGGPNRTCSYDNCTPASATSESARIMRKQVLQGVQASNPYAKNAVDASYQAYTLQIRWYIENIKTFQKEPDDEITDAKLPKYVKSSRPTISSPAGYSDGAKAEGGKASFGAVYKDADGDEPAQAEVWVDLNGDGRFNPDLAKGERIALKASGSDYKGGVTYTASGITPGYKGNQALRYVFRFADKNWYPPVKGGLMPSAAGTSAYGYGHFTLSSVSGNGSGTTRIGNHSPSAGPALTRLGDMVELQMEGGTGAYRIELTTMEGRRLRRHDTQASLFRLSTAGLEPGLYVLHVRGPGVNARHRLFLSHD